MQQTSVVIIGGGLVGLSAAMLLAWQDVPCVLLEKHSKQSLHPRAVGYTARTMEIFNAVRIADQIPQVPKEFRLRRVKVESLTGRWEEDPMPWNPSKDAGVAKQNETPEYTPFTGAALAQDRLEPIIRGEAQNLGADIRMGAKMNAFEQDASGVNVFVNTEHGSQYTIQAQYMIAADGHRSDVRDALGGTVTGRGHLNTVRSVLFKASLDEYKKGYQQFVIRQPGLEGFLTTYGDDRWVLMFTDDVERSAEEQNKAIRMAIGKDEIDFEIITTGRWELKAAIADTFQVGRVFLAGDAAHTLPPTRGGYGANTGIHDVHNLAWKLAAVLKGTCREELLSTYTEERRPVAWLRHQQTFARPDYAQYRQSSDDETQLYDDSAIELGQIYTSKYVFDDEKDSPKEPSARLPDQWLGRPGTRVPHMWLTNQKGEHMSSLDLFRRDWALVTENEQWKAVIAEATRNNSLLIQCITINGKVDYSDDGSYCRALGVNVGGASLVRPDGHVAWRSKAWPTDSVSALTAFVGAIAQN